MAITYFERPLNHEVYSLESGLAIVQNGDTASVAITSGQYIFLKNHSTLPNGGYHATTNIASGTTISSSNVVADADGIANALNGAVTTLNGSLASKLSATSYGRGYIEFSNGLKMCWGNVVFPAASTGVQNVSQTVPLTFSEILAISANWKDTASVFSHMGPVQPLVSSGNKINFAANRSIATYAWSASYIAIGT